MGIPRNFLAFRWCLKLLYDIDQYWKTIVRNTLRCFEIRGYSLSENIVSIIEFSSTSVRQAPCISLVPIFVDEWQTGIYCQLTVHLKQ